ncbi:hypothetical protein LTR86_010792 [Recurvomyces mirabilis]|nr:hypothetical protein LTR86_010792 [Recurvomyces mirabilis]
MATGERVVLDRLAYVIYEHLDIDTFVSFAKDFGFQNVGYTAEKGLTLFRGYGKDQYVYVAKQAVSGASKRFIGSGFHARSSADYERASRIPGAREIDLSSRPGGGKMVLLHDPNGFEMQILWDQDERLPPSQGISACFGGHPPMNGALEKYRKARHFGYETDNYDNTCAWYTQLFNLTPTDVLWAPGNEALDVAKFFRVDLGEEYVDHHCFLLTRGEKPGTTVHHSSFEVEDIDTQFMGHQWLADHGHEVVWGVGRHVHGSQVFDYWYDPSQYIIEHYADGDLVNENTKLLRAEAGNMAVWGPPVPVVWGGGKQISA